MKLLLNLLYQIEYCARYFEIEFEFLFSFDIYPRVIREIICKEKGIFFFREMHRSSSLLSREALSTYL